MSSEQLTFSHEINRVRQEQTTKLRDTLRALSTGPFKQYLNPFTPEFLINLLFGAFSILKRNPDASIRIEDSLEEPPPKSQDVKKRAKAESSSNIAYEIYLFARRASFEEITENFDSSLRNAVQKLPLNNEQKEALKDSFYVNVAGLWQDKPVPSNTVVIFFPQDLEALVNEISAKNSATVNDSTVEQFCNHLRAWANALERPVILSYPQEIFASPPCALKQILYAGGWLAAEDFEGFVKLMGHILEIAQVVVGQSYNEEIGLVDVILYPKTPVEIPGFDVRTNYSNSNVNRFVFTIQP